jgi:shikimate kinase
MRTALLEASSQKPEAMNIVLIGMRGAGKTAVARRVARQLGREYVEMDELIAKKAGMRIPEIVKNLGWDYFRDRETEVAREVSQSTNAVISAGGGVIVRPENIMNLKKNGTIVFLKVNIDTLLMRTGNDPNRPYLTGAKTRKEDMEKVLEQRKDLYLQAADIIIDANNKPLGKIVEEVILATKGDTFRG